MMDPLIKMAIGHMQFEAIHPFRDGEKLKNEKPYRLQNDIKVVPEWVRQLMRPYQHTNND